MKKLGIYLLSVLIITILVPTVIIKSFNFVPIEARGEEERPKEKEEKPAVKLEEAEVIRGERLETIKVYNSRSKKLIEVGLEEYIKGVVASEMPAKFHLEALKAQAIAARTYALSRTLKFSQGHPDHKKAPLCSSTHCQAYNSKEDLEELHGKKWIEDYWHKIEEAVESTSYLVLYYEGKIIEPLYHSTSGGKTEDAVHVFALDSPYLQSVDSPHEEEAPRYKDIKTFTVEEFIKILNGKFKEVKLTEKNFLEKIKLVEKTPSGRVKKIAIDKTTVEGRDIRDLLELNSTNFTISYDEKIKLIEVVTYGYGHGVGMSQWGANGMANKGKKYEEILKHYYSGIDIEKM